MPPRNAKTKLQDIARLTGHTVGTVSKALHNKPGISEKTRARILEAARESGYIGNALAGSLRSGTSKTAAIILGDIANPLFSIFAKGLMDALGRNGYSAILLDSDEDGRREERAVVTALSRNVDGVFLCPTREDAPGVELLRRNGVPCVLIGRSFESDSPDCVVFDDFRGGYLAAEHLISLGHRRILFLVGPECVSSARERKRGCLAALRDANVACGEGLMQEVGITADASQSIERLLRDGEHFTAVCAFSDYVAWQAIYVLNEHGLRVPEDVSVVGFDDIQSEIRLPVPLTTIACPKRLLGERAVELFLRRLARPDAPMERVCLPVSLVERRTAIEHG